MKPCVWAQKDSNLRPSACKADALNQLSYAPFFEKRGKDKCTICIMQLSFKKNKLIVIIKLNTNITKLTVTFVLQ